MNSKQVECFLSVAETLNFTRSSQLLFVSQPTVTHNIAALEAELGYRLFERAGKTVSLTPAGAHLYRSLKSIGVDLQNAVLRAKLFGEGYKRELVVGCGSSEYEESFLPGVVRRYRKQCPDVHLSFEMGPMREKLALLHEGKIDLLLATSKASADLARFEFVELRSYPLVCVMSQTNRLADRELVGMDDLADQSLVLLDDACAPPEIGELQRTLEHRYQANVIQKVQDMRMGHLVMLCDMGVAVMPQFKFNPVEGLVAVPFEWETKIPYGVLVAAGERRDHVCEFLRLVKQGFARLAQ